jgi:hypothetical protein
MWMTDNNGLILNEPIDLWNHSMDAIRYGTEEFAKAESDQEARIYKQPEWEGISDFES